MLVNGTGTADKDRLDYCNIIENLGDSSESLSETDANIDGTTPADGYTSGLTMYCYNTQAAGTSAAIYEFIFVKRIDPL